MSVLSVTCCSLLSAVCAFTLVSATGCGTDAQGVDDCREIEQARCEAAKSCGLISDVPGVPALLSRSVPARSAREPARVGQG